MNKLIQLLYIYIYISLVTEQEVMQAFKDNNNPESNVLVFLRHMNGIESCEGPMKRKFIDCTDDG